MNSRRKLTTILAADAVGYSRLMGDDEQATDRTLCEYRQVFNEHVVRHHGRIVDTAGDSVLAVFESAVEAVECSAEIQRTLNRRNSQLAEHRRMQFRIGLNVGDIITREDGTVFGDAVNIAARLQAIAEAGGICVSANVFEQIGERLPLEFVDLGEQHVKNVAKAVKAYKVAGNWTWRDLRDSSRIGAPRHLADKPSIAVLPFATFSSDSEQNYLSDSISEDIITALTRFTKLEVVARNSTFAYKGKGVDVRQIGKELGARYILEGSVRLSQHRARVTAQLIDATTGKHIWAENYDTELTDLFSVQDEVTQQIVGRLDVELDRAQLEQARRSPSKDLPINAYDLVLEARKQVYYMSEANHLESRDLLERAIAIDGQLAPAYIELAWIYLDEFRFGWNARPDPLDRALNAASRAVELEPNNGFAHWRLAKILFFRRESDRFDAEMRRALALNPNHAETLADVAVHLSQLDRTEEAYEYARRAAGLNPDLSWVYFVYAQHFYRKAQYREALASALQINIPEFYLTHFWRALPYAQLGQMDDARRAATQLLRLKPDFAWIDEVRTWNTAEPFALHAADGARKAGIPISRTDKP